MNSLNNSGISVITTVYNGAETILETVESILQQSFNDFEYVIIDDGSSDNTVKLLNKIDDPRVKFISGHRIGRGKALNKAIKTSCNEFIVILDADDVAHPERLKMQQKTMLENPSIAVLSSRFTTSGSGFPELRKPSQGSITVLNAKQFVKKNMICHSSVIMRRKDIEKSGLYDESRTELYDYDLWLRVLVNNLSMACLEETLVFKRLHKNQYYERQKRLKYLASTYHCRRRAVKISKCNSLYYLFPVFAFMYGLLPISIRKKFMG